MFQLRNESIFLNVHGIKNHPGLLQSTLTLQETRSIHDRISMKRPKNEFIAYIYILLYISKNYI